MLQFTIPCLMINQRNNQAAPPYAIFAAPAGEIVQWAGITRRPENVQGTQRALNRAKLNGLSKFLDKNHRNTGAQATTITLRFEPGQLQTIDVNRKFYVITLNVPDNATDDQKPGMIIDGQHRLFGINSFNPTYLVNVVALLNVNDLE